jgi:hypothetical protein
MRRVAKLRMRGLAKLRIDGVDRLIWIRRPSTRIGPLEDIRTTRGAPMQICVGAAVDEKGDWPFDRGGPPVGW